MNLSSLVGPAVEAILRIAIELLLPILLAYLAKMAHDEIQHIAAKKQTAEFQLVKEIVKRMVLAAEQLGITGALKDIGEEKKKFVLDMVKAELERRGMHIDVDTLDALIEAEVHESFTQVEQDLADLFDLQNGGDQPAQA